MDTTKEPKTLTSEELETKLAGVINKEFDDTKQKLEDACDDKIKAAMKEFNIGPIERKHGIFPGVDGADNPEVSKIERCAKFIKALFRKDITALAEFKTMSEGEDSAGGFLVPEEFQSGVDRIVENFGLVRKFSRKITMGRDVMNVPTLGDAATVTWPGELNAGSDGSPTFNNIKMVAKTAMGLSPVSNELLEDSNTSIVSILMELFGEALAGAEDTQGLVGVGAPFTGILNNTDVTTVTMASGKDTFAEADLDDYRDLITQIKSTILPGSIYVMHRANWALVQKITENSQHVSTFQNPITSLKPEGGSLVPMGTLWGYPVYTSDQMPSVTAVSTDFILFGNFKHLYFGNRKQMTLSISDSATIGSLNTFESNAQAVRVLERVSINVGIPTAFAKLRTAAS